MPDITFRDEQLESWFNDTYTATNASAENATAYHDAQDKDAFRREKIAAERKTRLIAYWEAIYREHGAVVSVQEMLDRDMQEALQKHPQITEEQVIKNMADIEIRERDAQSQNIRANFDTSNQNNGGSNGASNPNNGSSNNGPNQNNRGPRDTTNVGIVANGEVRSQDAPNQNNQYGRERSPYSDRNAFAFDTLRIETLQDMKVISDKDAKDLTPQKAIELLNKTMPSLNDAQLKEMESRFADKIIDDDSAFRFVPPSMLAKKYDELSATIEATANNNNQQEAHQKALAQKEKIAGRIDQLTDMLVNNEHGPEDLYFADPTNTADVHDGYTAMFEARAKDLRAQQDNSDNENVRQALAARLARMETGQNMLNEKMAEYEQVYNISDITPENADDLDKRFDSIEKQLDKTQPNEETLALVSNFKFLDDNGKPKPQFIDKDGKESDVYTPGAKVIKGSELETAIQLAKQKTTLLTLGTKDELTPEFLQQQLSDNLSGTLYSLHITNQVNNGILEDPKQFTNPQYLEQFKKDLANTQKPMAIHTQVFDQGVDRIVNETGGYATALNNKLKKDKDSPTPSVVLKLFNPIEKIDKRAADRTQSDANRLKFRSEMRKRLLKSGVSAFAVSTGITVLSAGTNKIVGAAAGLGLGLALTAYQLRKHYKQSKKAGKRFKLDRNLALTLGTTALSGFAIGAMATGNPEMAVAAGLGALALGSTNGGIQIAKQAKEAGVSKAETAAWIVGQVAVNLGAAYAGRLAGGAIVDAVNTHTDSNIFKHETTTTKTVTESSQEFEQGTHEASLKTLRTMYTDEQHHFHEAELQAKIDQNLKFIDDNRQIFEDRGYQLDDPTQKLALAEKMELTKIALGENTGIDTLQHIDGGGIHHSHGNHFTMTDKVLAADGFRDPAQARSDFMNMFNSNDPDAISKGMDSFEKINMDVLGKHNEINYSDAQTMANSHHDGVLHRDAVLGDDGKLHVDWQKGTEFNTYAEGPGTLHSQTHETTVTTTEYVPNEVHPGVGMFGILGNIFNRKLKDRDGALADKIKEIRRKIVDPKPTPVIDDPKPKPHDDPKPKPHDDPKPKPHDDPKPKPHDDPKPKPHDDPKPKPQDDHYGYGKLLADEYKIVYGVAPEVIDNEDPKSSQHKRYQHWIDYNNRVDAERKAQNEKKGQDLDMWDFLTERRQAFDEIVQNKQLVSRVVDESTGRQTEKVISCLAVTDDYKEHRVEDPENAKVVRAARQSLWKSNLTSDNYQDKVTLSHFTDYTQQFVAGNDFVADGTRDISQNPELKRDIIRENANSGSKYFVTDLNDFYFENTDKSYDEKRAILHADPQKEPRSAMTRAGDALKKMLGISRRHPKNGPVVSVEQTNER